jgi:hypothetical protein
MKIINGRVPFAGIPGAGFLGAGRVNAPMCSNRPDTERIRAPEVSDA